MNYALSARGIFVSIFRATQAGTTSLLSGHVRRFLADRIQRLPFADCRCYIAIAFAFDNSGFTGILRAQIVSFGATKVRRESPDL